jgi:hypothetical protein
VYGRDGPGALERHWEFGKLGDGVTEFCYSPGEQCRALRSFLVIFGPISEFERPHIQDVKVANPHFWGLLQQQWSSNGIVRPCPADPLTRCLIVPSVAWSPIEIRLESLENQHTAMHKAISWLDMKPEYTDLAASQRQVRRQLPVCART